GKQVRYWGGPRQVCQRMAHLTITILADYCRLTAPTWGSSRFGTREGIGSTNTIERGIDRISAANPRLRGHADRSCIRTGTRRFTNWPYPSPEGTRTCARPRRG